MATILVNSTAARSGGAVSILNQFIENIPANSTDKYYFFIDSLLKRPDTKNLTFVVMNTVRWIDRMKWDYRGFKEWTKQNKIFPDLIISFQNTGVNYLSHVPQIIYFHQLLPLSNFRWNIFRKNERLLYFYTVFYAFFVKISLNENTHVVVQIPSTKAAFSEKFKFSMSKILVVRPTIKPISPEQIIGKNFDDNKIHFLYPSFPYVYKNHKLLLQALAELKKNNYALYTKIAVHFTCSQEDLKYLNKEMRVADVSDCLIFEGQLTYQQVLSLYKSVQVVLFPSLIESFGLPLIEAATFGLPILVVDLPYASDVISDYEGAILLDCRNPLKWAEAISDSCQNTSVYPPLHTESKNGSWEVFTKLIDELK